MFFFKWLNITREVLRGGIFTCMVPFRAPGLVSDGAESLLRPFRHRHTDKIFNIGPRATGGLYLLKVYE